MFILCCGPDTFRATQRARELEAAFRAKHDPTGSSIERLEPGKGAADEVIERSLTVSLFSPMRFIRADGLIEQCPKTKTKPLAHALSQDPDRVIVVSIEQEKPTGAALKPFADVPKLIVNDYPLLKGKAFFDWVSQAGSSLGVHDAEALKRLADACDGDAWLASNELLKLSAGGASDVVQAHAVGTYDVADAFLAGDPSRYRRLSAGPVDRALYPLLQQSTAALKVRDGESEGIPAFAISKLKRIDQTLAASVAGAAVLVMMLSRSGLAETEELAALLP